MKKYRTMVGDKFRGLANQLGLRCTWPHSFAQEGEDLILSRFIGEKKGGFYVDVGAHHPVRYSNTYLFYLRGWQGVNVDAMPGSMEPFRRLRPRDQNIEAAVSNSQRSLTYFAFNDPAMNTCDPNIARQRDGLEHYRVIETRTIQPESLGALLRNHLAPGQHVDFLSVDVEGLDLDVLTSNDWQRFRPTVILTEDFGIGTIENVLKSDISVFLSKHGYRLFAKTVNTLFFEKMGS